MGDAPAPVQAKPGGFKAASGIDKGHVGGAPVKAASAPRSGLALTGVTRTWQPATVRQGPTLAANLLLGHDLHHAASIPSTDACDGPLRAPLTVTRSATSSRAIDSRLK